MPSAVDEPFWTAFAGCFDVVAELLPYEQMLADAADLLAVGPGMKVLDVGCGTGNLVRRLAQDSRRPRSRASIRRPP